MIYIYIYICIYIYNIYKYSVVKIVKGQKKVKPCRVPQWKRFNRSFSQSLFSYPHKHFRQ